MAVSLPPNDDLPCSATVELELQDEACAGGIYRALLPESTRPPGRRSRVQLKHEGRKLAVQLQAEDVVALRASFNSYLRWICALKKSYEILSHRGTSL